MQNINDRSKLAQAEESRFIEQCKEEFIERSLAATNSRKARVLSVVSYLPNVISGITAGFFVVYLLSGYPRHVAAILGALLLAVVVSVEIGKRGLIGALAKDYLTAGKIQGLAVVALVLLVAVSMGASYQGGKQLITETASPPPRQENPQIDSLNRILADQQATIERLQRTTWKGKVTRDAVKGINQAKAIQSSLVERITALQTADDAAYSETLAKHTGQRMNFGYLLGILAALADAFLLGILWTVKRLRYEVAAIHYQASLIGTGTGAQYLTGKDALNVPPPTLNQGQRERRRIGFHREEPEDEAHDQPLEDNDQPLEDNDKPSYDKSLNGESLQEKEVVTIREREVVELTDRVKVCAHCGQKFVYYSAKAKYCSAECRVAAWEKRHGKKFWKSNS